jgi:hypothetical protein
MCQNPATGIPDRRRFDGVVASNLHQCARGFLEVSYINRLTAPLSAIALGLDIDQFREEVNRHRYLDRIREDVEGGTHSGVRGTPTFFINGIRHEGGYDLQTMREALRVAANAA